MSFTVRSVPGLLGLLSYLARPVSDFQSREMCPCVVPHLRQKQRRNGYAIKRAAREGGRQRRQNQDPTFDDPIASPQFKPSPSGRQVHSSHHVCSHYLRSAPAKISFVHTSFLASTLALL